MKLMPFLSAFFILSLSIPNAQSDDISEEDLIKCIRTISFLNVDGHSSITTNGGSSNLTNNNLIVNNNTGIKSNNRDSNTRNKSSDNPQDVTTNDNNATAICWPKCCYDDQAFNVDKNICEKVDESFVLKRPEVHSWR